MPNERRAETLAAAFRSLGVVLGTIDRLIDARPDDDPLALGALNELKEIATALLATTTRKLVTLKAPPRRQPGKD